MNAPQPDAERKQPASDSAARSAPPESRKLNIIALILGVIVFGLLAYGVIETAVKAAALFTG